MSSSTLRPQFKRKTKQSSLKKPSLAFERNWEKRLLIADCYFRLPYPLVSTYPQQLNEQL